MGLESHPFTAATGTSGAERIPLSKTTLLFAEIAVGGAPILVSVQLGAHGKSMALEGMHGYVHRGQVEVTSVGLTWQGRMPVRVGDQLIVFWDNRTGSEASLTLEWVTE